MMKRINIVDVFHFIVARFKLVYFPGFLFRLFGLFPLKNKIVATTMRGRKYADNPRYIVEELHRLYSQLDIVWLKNDSYSYELPSFVRSVSYYSVRKIFELSTAKVWINSHRVEGFFKKRKGQLFVNTWHGSYAVKKIELDLPEVRNNKWDMKELRTTSSLVDVFISDSDFLSQMYRNAIGFKGCILKCGLPRNDVFYKDYSEIDGYLTLEKEKAISFLSDNLK